MFRAGGSGPLRGANRMSGFEIEYLANTLMFLAVMFAGLGGFDLFDSDSPGDDDTSDPSTDGHYVGTSGDDVFVETASLSRIYDLFAGDDRLEAGQGDDTIHGGEGDDSISGRGGDDDVRGGPGDDALLGGTGADSLYGGESRDVLSGEAGDDFLDGGLGDDRLDGGLDADTLMGGLGNDTLTGGAGADMLSGGANADVLDGVTGESTVPGAAGRADTLSGGDGQDRLILGAGDTGIGGNGPDTFTVDQSVLDDAPVLVSDFNPSSDTIEIEYAAPSPGQAAPGVQVVDFADGTGANILLDDTLVASITGAQGLDPGAIQLIAV